jgi:hypothetical protein
MKKLIVILCIIAFSASVAFAVDSYQVTGTVTDVKADKIVVKKGKENFEIAKDAATPTKGDVKVGSKVTVKYTMKAINIEGKDDTKKKDDKKKK